jgi:hypothetical protein
MLRYGHIHRHSADWIFSFLPQYRQLRLGLRRRRSRSIHLDNFGKNTDRDFLRRGGPYVETGWSPDLAQPVARNLSTAGK